MPYASDIHAPPLALAEEADQPAPPNPALVPPVVESASAAGLRAEAVAERVNGSAGLSPARVRAAAPPVVWPGRQRARRRERLLDRVEVFISRLSNRNNFWRRVCSLIWLPYAFRAGIRVKRLGEGAFTAVLPFRRFNRNWYNAMAGAALLANSEIAGGMYIFGACDGNRRVVCKKLSYTFLRPCLGPAVYEVIPEREIAPLIESGAPFNIDVRIDVRQQLGKPGHEKRVGRCMATYHVAPVADPAQRRARKRKNRSRDRARAARLAKS